MTDTAAIAEDPRLIRAFMESPILDDHKRAKLPSLQYDALLVDLEDSVAPHRKAEARAKVVEVLSATENRVPGLLVPRVNPLGSGYFDGDMAALAEAPFTHLAYPMLQTLEELEEVVDRLAAVGHRPRIFASVETARGVQNVDAFAAHPQVCGLLFGPSDLGLDMGLPLDAAKDITGPALQYARSRVIVAAAANRIACISMAFPTRLKDLEQTREHIEHGRHIGLTGMMAFYPPHLDIINDVFTPSHTAVAKAAESVAVYEAAREAGLATAYLADGELVLAFDYEQAKETLRRDAVFQGGINVR